MTKGKKQLSTVLTIQTKSFKRHERKNKYWDFHTSIQLRQSQKTRWEVSWIRNILKMCYWYGATTLILTQSWRGVEFCWLPHLECNSGSQLCRSVNCSWPWIVFIAVHFHRGINAFLPRTGVPLGHSPADGSGASRVVPFLIPLLSLTDENGKIFILIQTLFHSDQRCQMYSLLILFINNQIWDSLFVIRVSLPLNLNRLSS